MSSYVVNDQHISYILAAALFERYPGDYVDYYWKPNGERRMIKGREQEVGQILLDQNVRSVGEWYKDSTNPDTQPDQGAVFSFCYTGDLTYRPVEILKALDGFAYQAGDTPDWYETEAWAIVNALRLRTIRTLPGYEEATTWGF